MVQRFSYAQRADRRRMVLKNWKVNEVMTTDIMLKRVNESHPEVEITTQELGSIIGNMLVRRMKCAERIGDIDKSVIYREKQTTHKVRQWRRNW